MHLADVRSPLVVHRGLHTIVLIIDGYGIIDDFCLTIQVVCNFFYHGSGFGDVVCVSDVKGSAEEPEQSKNQSTNMRNI